MKKIISLLLCLALCLSLGTMAFAEEGGRQYAKAAEMLENDFSDCQIAEARIEEDLVLFENVGISTENFFAVSEYDGDVIYHKTSGEGIETSVKIAENDNGDIDVDFYQDDLHDTITYLADGGILLNGHDVKFTFIDDNGNEVTYSSANITPQRARWAFYQDEPIIGEASDYSNYTQTRQGNIDFEEKIFDMTVEAIKLFVGEALEVFCPGISELSDDVIDMLAIMIKDRVLVHGPDAEFVYYVIKVYSYKEVIPLEQHLKYVGKYYIASQPVGPYINYTYYYANLFS